MSSGMTAADRNCSKSKDSNKIISTITSDLQQISLINLTKRINFKKATKIERNDGLKTI